MRPLCATLLIVCFLFSSIPFQTYAQNDADVSIREIKEVGGRGTTEVARWSPDGTQIAIGGSRGLWLYTANFELLWHQVPPSDFLPYHVTDVEWNHDGSYLAIASNFHRNVQIWYAKTQSLYWEYETTDSIDAISWQPEKNMIVAVFGSSDRQSVTILDVDNRKIVHSLEGQAGRIRNITWCAASNRIAATERTDRTLFIWDGLSGELLSATDTELSLNKIDCSIDGTQLAVPAHDGENWLLVLWDMKTLQEAKRVVVNGANFLRWHPQNPDIVAIGSYSTVNVWDLSQEKIVETVGNQDDAQISFDWHPAEEQLLITSGNNFVSVYDIATNQVLNAVEGHSWLMRGFTWHPSQNRIAAAEVFDLQSRVTIWNIDDGTILSQFGIEGFDTIEQMEWRQQGDLLAVRIWGLSVEIWDVSHPEPALMKFFEYEDRAMSFSWSPLGDKLAILTGEYGDEVQQLEIWDIESDTSISTSIHANAIDWNPVRDQIGGVSCEGIVVVNAETLKEINTIESQAGFYTLIEWDSTGRAVFVSENVDSFNGSHLIMWGPQNINLVQPFDDTIHALEYLDMHPNRPLVLTSQWITDANIWNVLTGETYQPLDNPSRFSQWNHDGSLIASIGQDVLRIWEITYTTE